AALVPAERIEPPTFGLQNCRRASYLFQVAPEPVQRVSVSDPTLSAISAPHASIASAKVRRRMVDEGSFWADGDIHARWPTSGLVPRGKYISSDLDATACRVAS